MENLQYPIGKFKYNKEADINKFNSWIQTIEEFPSNLDVLLKSMDVRHLDITYRPEGWTGRQVVHHLADSHSHALIRFKWSLTENHPAIKAYKENLYAQLADYTLPIEPAVMMLFGIHQKWSHIITNMNENDWQKGYQHPESNKFFTLREATALYAWHCKHHLGHLEIIAKK